MKFRAEFKTKEMNENEHVFSWFGQVFEHF